MLPQQYCLRWKYHHSNLQTMFSQLLDRGCFCDVTLACEGQLIRAHRVVLCACSTFFDTVLTNYASEKDPIIIMKDVTFADIKCLIEFMYKGEINVEHTSLASLLKTADELKIKGLAEVSWREDEPDPFVMPDTRMQENIPHNDQRANYEARIPSSFVPPVHHRIPNMPVLTHLPSTGVEEHVGPKRKRGRPPLDDSYDAFSTPKTPSIPPNNDFNPGDPIVPLNPSPVNEITEIPLETKYFVDQNTKSRECPQSNIELETEDDPPQEVPSNARQNSSENNELSDQEIDRVEESSTDDERKCPNDPERQNQEVEDPDYEQKTIKLDDIDNSESNLTSEELAQWGDVIKMDAYLAKGRRPQFWEEPFTRRVLEAIKNKKLEMKKAAKVLGVSYGTLYGRYREVYGCLKHPYRLSTTMMGRYDLWPHKRSDNKLHDLRNVWLR